MGRRKRKPARRRSVLLVILGAFSNIIVIIIGLLLLALTIGGIYAADYLTGVLRDINTLDSSEPEKRIRAYESYFCRLPDGYRVVPTEPFIREGEKYYLWTVTPPKSGEGEVFRWKLVLSDNQVVPLTPAAKRLDNELGFSTPGLIAGE